MFSSRCRPPCRDTLHDARDEIDFVRALAAEQASPNDVWLLESQAAMLSWAASVRAHYEARGEGFFDHRAWEIERDAAMAAYRRAYGRYRRKQGDREIIERLESLEGKARDGGYKVTSARRRVIQAVVRVASESGRLYCGYASLASLARVSPKSACTVRAELEALGVLERVRTGGKASDGRCQSNKYTIKWNVLRDVLGIANRWDTSYPEDTTCNVRRRRANVYYSYEGCAHYSQSARQMRRLAKRAREAAEERARAGSAAVENYMSGRLGGVPAVENDAVEQDFYALTVLPTHNNSLKDQPATPPMLLQEAYVDNGTRQSRSDSRRPAGGNDDLCFDIAGFSPDTQARLRSIRPARTPYLLAEVDTMVLQHPGTQSQATMQSRAENILLSIMDADKSLFIPQAPDRIKAATPHGSEK